MNQAPRNHFSRDDVNHKLRGSLAEVSIPTVEILHLTTIPWLIASDEV